MIAAGSPPNPPPRGGRLVVPVRPGARGPANARHRGAAEARARRPRAALRLRAGAPPAQGAARHRAGGRGALGPIDGRRARRGGAERLPERLPRSRGVPRARASPATGGADAPLPSPIPREKTIVEHTAINPNKAAHIGHLRNSALGDTLVRLLRFSGVPVEVQNYIDDTGVQVADVVVGFQHLEGKYARRGDGARRTSRASTTTAGTSTRASPSGTRPTSRALAVRADDAARHRARRGRRGRDGRRHRRPHRPLPPEDDGAARTSTTTCSRGKATSCGCSSGRRPSRS